MEGIAGVTAGVRLFQDRGCPAYGPIRWPDTSGVLSAHHFTCFLLGSNDLSCSISGQLSVKNTDTGRCELQVSVSVR